MKMGHQNIKKKGKLTVVVLLIGFLILGGTFAWQSISQTAKNEVKGEGINPGGRLHDDFDGQNKDVYVENFGNQPIFARVRLDEYMEFGVNAGTKGSGATPLVAGSSFDDVTSWTPHIPATSNEDCDNGNGEDDFHDYFKWTMGGKTTYMPTFNMNKDSLKADINGTMAGKYGEPYDDYTSYQPGEKITDMEIWDDDANDIEDGGIKQIKREHTAKETPVANVIKMAEWDGTQSDTWLLDTDGWAYYAKPIAPHTSTGLLLSEIKLINEPLEDWYYSINVIAQFATAGDWGQEDGTGFFDTSVKGIGEPSDTAIQMLNQIAGIYDISVTSANNVTSIQPGDTLQMNTEVSVGGISQSKVLHNKQVVWEVKAPQGSETKATIDDSGLLTVPEDESNTELMIRARLDDNKSYGQFKIKVNR